MIDMVKSPQAACDGQRYDCVDDVVGTLNSARHRRERTFKSSGGDDIEDLLSQVRTYESNSDTYLLPGHVIGALDSGTFEEHHCIERLSCICKELLRSGLLSYTEFRDEWLLCHLRLNLVGRLCPLFRPSMKAPFKPQNQAEREFLLDRQLIDLHWLHCSGYRRDVGQDEFRYMMHDEEFDWQGAVDFALTEVSADVKARSWLALCDLEMHQLASIKSDQARARWSELTGPSERHITLSRVKAILCGHYRTKANNVELVKQDSHAWLAARLLNNEAAATQTLLYRFFTGAEACERAPSFAKRRDRIEKVVASHRRQH